MVQESMVLRLVLTTITAYLLGGVPFGYLFVRFALGKDIRTIGKRQYRRDKRTSQRGR